MIHISNIDGITIISPMAVEHAEADRETRRRIEWGRKNPHLAGKVAPLTPYVRALCKRVSDNEPRTVQVKPYEGARPQRCYANVDRYCQIKGGLMVSGWKVWESPDYYNFEHHCVWVDGEGNLTCVTPQLLDEKTILFLPDIVMTAEYAEENLADIRSEHFFPKDPDDELACELCEVMTLGAQAAFAGRREAERHWRREAFRVCERMHERHKARPRLTPKQRAAHRKKIRRSNR